MKTKRISEAFTGFSYILGIICNWNNTIMDVFSSCVIASSSVKVIALSAFAWPLLASLYISSALKAGTETDGREICILSQWPFPMALSINHNENPQIVFHRPPPLSPVNSFLLLSK